MSPISGLSEQRRIPRIGKIHLGYKDPKKNGAPTATNYFVLPDEPLELKEICGDRPTELPILIPVEDEEYWASQYYRCYSRTRGLVCKGDGVTARMMIDTETENMANRDSKEVVWKEIECKGRECPHYQAKQCREVMNLQFLLPEVPGLGVWQIDTSSVNSIRNINSSAELIRGICGRIRMIPLLLVLERQEVVNPDDGKKKNVCVLNLRHSQSLHSLITDSTRPIHELLAPVPEEAKEAPLDVEPQEPEQVSSPPLPQKPKQASTSEKETVLEAPSEKNSKTDELLQWVLNNNPKIHTLKSARSWLKMTCQISEERIDDDPEGVIKEISEHFPDWK